MNQINQTQHLSSHEMSSDPLGDCVKQIVQQMLKLIKMPALIELRPHIPFPFPFRDNISTKQLIDQLKANLRCAIGEEQVEVGRMLP